MAEIHHFTYGAFNPVGAFLVAILGSFLGLLCTKRARNARTRGRRTRWLIIASFAIGGAAIWLMHFTAMLGFDVPQSPVRYNPVLTMLSLGLAVVAVGFGLMVVGHGRPSLLRVVVAGVLTGAGVLTMHYTGMAALHVSGTIQYRPTLVVASAVIAVVAATTALWFTVAMRGGLLAMLGAAAIMAVAVCGMHYTGMAAMSVRLSDTTSDHVSGMRPLLMIVPITLISAATIIGVALSALQAMTEEEFTDGAGIPQRGGHAEHVNHGWSLQQAALSTARRPSPQPVPPRPVPAATPAATPAPTSAATSASTPAPDEEVVTS
ncbi:MHYT domain-containing protein [Actinoplanes sp. N902-109]|uniref:MHYT domain-containing protein n=1 Tax=Actinoplanes sp. (strain N902-109) TaxID=649831 RepID=UPI0003294199|nr:MHYT domain-containing protein [Actinoplanes sp. N902-109]AGL14894.1 integral membrane sensor protein [Actinoplanes sp. N902-109]